MLKLAYNNNMIASNPIENRHFIPLPSECLNNFCLDILNVIAYKIIM